MQPNKTPRLILACVAGGLAIISVITPFPYALPVAVLLLAVAVSI